jgi:mono/diheme cytochrome c family protein
VARTCVGCHSNRAKAGNLSLEGFSVDAAASDRDTAEKMIRKLRAGQMPPPGARRPDATARRQRSFLLVR